jgi:hypothetical protein
MWLGGDKKTNAKYKDTCFRSYKLMKPMIRFRNYKGQKKEVTDQFGSATIRETQSPSDAVKRLLRAILTSRHLASGTDVSTSVRFEVLERVPIDADGKRTNFKNKKKGLKKFIHVYEGSGVKAGKPRFIKMKNGSSKEIKTLFASVKLKHISKSPFTKNGVEKNITHVARNRQNAKKSNNTPRRNTNTQKLNRNYAKVNSTVKKNNAMNTTSNNGSGNNNSNNKGNNKSANKSNNKSANKGNNKGNNNMNTNNNNNNMNTNNNSSNGK